jgi:putative ABC transport system permease protein
MRKPPMRWPMFWRIVGRLLTANYGRVFLILLALGAGAGITAALLNLQIDAKRRLTGEFRALGANVIVAPRDAEASSSGTTLDESLLAQIPATYEGKPVPAVAFLYLIGQVAKAGSSHFESAVIAGYTAGDKAGYKGDGLVAVRPGQRTEYSGEMENDPSACEVGAKVASQFHVSAGDSLQLSNQSTEASCKVFAVVATGGPEDAQIFAHMGAVQSLAGLPGRVSLIQLSVNGTPASIHQFITSLAQKIPNADVHGIKQLAEAEGRLYDRINGLLSATVLIVLLLTSLSVMAGMSNVAIERKNDVGLMKAIGGSVRRVVELFLAEAVVLGIVGGLVGSALGLIGSIWLGKAVFGVAAEPRWIVYPVSVALTVIVSVASALPLRRLASIRPANVFRGEA